MPSAGSLATMLLVSPLAAAILVLVPEPLTRLPWVHRWISERVTHRFQDIVTVGASLVSLALVFALAGTMTQTLHVRLWMLHLYVDALSLYFVLLVNAVALVASFYAGRSWARRTGRSTLSRTAFYSLFNAFHFTMVLVPLVANLVVLWIGIELTTVTSTLLVAAERRREAFEAAWKYIVITSTGIIFALLGTLFLARAIPSDQHPSMDWPDLVGSAGELNDDLVRLSFLFILVGYGTKAGFAPMHTWLPDAHGEAPYPVSALLSGVLLKSALYAILRFYTITNLALPDHGAFTSQMLLGAGLLSLVVSVPFILKSNRFKRILAYHSLEHMGIITLGLGIGGPVALFGALLHVLNHGLTKSLMFLAYGNVQDSYAGTEQAPENREAASRSPTDVRGADPSVEPYGGVLRAMPVTGALLGFGGLALVGSPPFSIFLSEFLILWGGVQQVLEKPSAGLIASLVVFVLSVTLIFGGLVRHLGRILIGDPPSGVVRETWRQIVPLLFLLAVIVWLGFDVPAIGPLDLRQLLDDSVTIVCGGACP
ncbi:hydrogenase 4 subunit F [Virgisporangium ochraceum]|uniref:NADH dehydrogenase n=1 Tax=Virgisporangium ochraceum TaxID=65505 RepID=A0A8J3ZVC4_9ACTN|nr:proton-conducting transporter membrane subunit [Virgisporangium ochraceum]GIJ70634.1 NADH dehydrogenase [Virgisporangium ochraceum]